MTTQLYNFINYEEISFYHPTVCTLYFLLHYLHFDGWELQLCKRQLCTPVSVYRTRPGGETLPYYDAMHPDDRKVCEEVALKCFEKPGHAFPATIRKHDDKGSYIITQWEYIAGVTEAGEPEGVFCMGYDVTEPGEKTERMKQIAFEQSHTVRRPLANILGLADIMSKMDIDAGLQNLADMLLQNADELDKVIRTIVNKTQP